MALNIKVIPDQSCDTNCVMHSMPCKINHDANITGFFSPYVENKDTDFINKADAVLEASFHGYPLQGKKIKIPHDFKGIVIGEMKKHFTDMEPRNIYVQKNFGEITYWNWVIHNTDYSFNFQ
ncbi:hypothetical protein GHT06_010786 [Daphnia sinensis]|uniref:Uncharacterized protein n=1 Tax=Daphnia sinensis TaxID=1820382 RepID=A0AAD5PXR5_9CRUS|nr:hypothetical protein GHT06_010786 [Daphnia sinensis]